MSITADVYALQAKFGFNHEPLDMDKLRLRESQMNEELMEFSSAIHMHDSEQTVDALIDLTVFALGTLALLGVDIDQAWDEVHYANMSKIRGTKPERSESGGWDLVKPNDWEAPEHDGNTGFLNDIFDAHIMSEMQ